MFDLQWVIDTVGADPVFEVDWAKVKEPLVQDIKHFPFVFVKPIGVQNDREMFDTPDIYPQRDLSLIFTFETQLIVPLPDLTLRWKHLRSLLLGKNPVSADQNYSSINYHEGGAMGLDSGKILWADRWRISTPISVHV
jgi:hypothetical protein